MKTIHKQYLDIKHHQKVEIKGFVKFLKVEEQNNRLVFWYIVNSNSTKIKTINFEIYGTGLQIDDDTLSDLYLDTVVMPNGLVWHIFKY